MNDAIALLPVLIMFIGMLACLAAVLDEVGVSRPIGKLGSFGLLALGGGLILSGALLLSRS